MKRGIIEKWTDIPACTNLLFFSQLVNELLFDYSIPSNRISTLNSHYLCLDALSAIDGIENHGVQVGTLKPIMEEFYMAICKDPVFTDNYNPLDFFMKYQNEKYVKCQNVKELNYQDSKSITEAIYELFFNGNEYYEHLKSRITTLITHNDADDQQELFRLIKSLLTELMNNGYSTKYLYMVMRDLFWESKTTINVSDKINEFFTFFDFKQKHYVVIFRPKLKIKKLINNIEDIDCINELSPEIEKRAEKRFLAKGKDETFLEIKRDAFDPYDAYEKAVSMIDINASVYRLYDHTYRYDIGTAVCEVLDDNDVYSIGKKIRPVEHTKIPSTKHISEGMNLADEAIMSTVKSVHYQEFMSILSAIEYHSHSLDSRAEENQLLDLWAIFESVLDISNKHTADRIQQICMYLVSVLKQRYIYSLFKQLADDIRIYNENEYNAIVSNTTDEKEIIKLICEFTILDETKPQREEFLNNLDDFPLLKERICYYSSMLSTPASVNSFVEKHAERVRWQIMRIYRNRNLIIHNGSKMAYLHLLIENLHSYVDDFMSYTIHSLSNGKSVQSMCQELFVKECKWNSEFSPKCKASITKEQIENMLSM